MCARWVAIYHDAPLTIAARFGQAKAVEWLLQIGADAKHHGSAALRCATFQHHGDATAARNVVKLRLVRDGAMRLLVCANISVDVPIDNNMPIRTTCMPYAIITKMSRARNSNWSKARSPTVIKLVVSAVWQMRMDPGWERSQESPAKAMLPRINKFSRSREVLAKCDSRSIPSEGNIQGFCIASIQNALGHRTKHTLGKPPRPGQRSEARHAPCVRGGLRRTCRQK